MHASWLTLRPTTFLAEFKLLELITRSKRFYLFSSVTERNYTEKMLTARYVVLYSNFKIYWETLHAILSENIFYLGLLNINYVAKCYE
jgi:hypothetical protein